MVNSRERSFAAGLLNMLGNGNDFFSEKSRNETRRDPNQVISTWRASQKPRRMTNLSQGLFLKHRSCERPCEELLPWLKWITGGNPTSTVLRNLLEKTERERRGLATGATLTSPFSSIVHRNISVETSTRFLSHARDLLYPHRNLANFFPSSQRFL